MIDTEIWDADFHNIFQSKHPLHMKGESTLYAFQKITLWRHDKMGQNFKKKSLQMNFFKVQK